MAEDLDSLAVLVYQRARAIETTFAKFRAREFATSHFDTFARFPQQAAREIKRSVAARLRDASKPGVDAKNIARLLRRYGQALEFVHTSLDFVLNAEVLSIPAPFVLFLEELASRYLEPRFVLQGASDFNYSFTPVSHYLNDPLEQAGLKKARLPDGFSIFRFPASLREDGLQHCILGHELGHYLDEREALWQKSWLGATPAVQSRIERFIRTQMGTVPKGIPSEQMTDALETYASWISEVVCDLVGSRLVGPAFMLSSVEFLRFNAELGLGGSTHPPSSLRLWITSEELRALGWGSYIAAHKDLACPKPKGWLAKDIASLAPGERSMRVLERCLLELLPAIRRVVRTHVGDRAYREPAFAATWKSARELLVNLVPPGEVRIKNGEGIAVDPRTIVNAGWFFQAEGYPGWPDIKGDNLYRVSEKRLLLSRLVLKALEVSYLRTHWKKLV